MVYKRILKTVLAAGTLLLPMQVGAFEIKHTKEGLPIHWASMPIDFVIAAEGGRDLSRGQSKEAIRDAFLAWSGVSGVDISFRDLGTAEGLVAQYDETNAIVWVNEGWATSRYPADAMAVTLTTYRNQSGELVDADIAINERDVVWGVGAEVRNDLQNALTHEVGHFLGLAHSVDESATMFPRAVSFEISKREISEDDKRGLRAIYTDEELEELIPKPKPTVITVRTDEDDRERIGPASTNGCANQISDSNQGWLGVVMLAWWTRRRRFGLRGN